MSALSHGLSMPTGGLVADPAFGSSIVRAVTWAAPDPATIIHDPWAAPSGAPIALSARSPWPAPDPLTRSIAMPPPAALGAVPAVLVAPPRPTVDELHWAPAPIAPPVAAPAATAERTPLGWRIMAALAAAGAAIVGLSSLAAFVF